MRPNRTELVRLLALTLGALATVLLGAPATRSAPAVAEPVQSGSPGVLVGAWKTQTYTMKDGPTHRVEGMIFFTESDWSVLFFVVDDGGVPQRGSAEGGTYELAGEALTFTHLYNASGGGAVEGLPASDWSMRINERGQAPTEPARIDLSGERLTIHFPSGNHMTFTRSS